MKLVRFQFLTAVSMKMTFFWDVAIIALMMEAVSTSETSVNFYQATWHNIPEDSHLNLNDLLSLHFDCCIL
jgi:hypothetical protein